MTTQVAAESGTLDVAAQPEKSFVSHATFSEDHDHTLVTACSDPRFVEATQEFIRSAIGVRKFDPLFEPGGPAIFLLAYSIFFVTRPQGQLLHQAHDIRRVVGIAHYDCRFYLAKHPNLTPEKLRERQTRDLQEFKSEIARITPAATVELYYAHPNAEGRIEFSSVS